jgi:membrane protease YdiL (CAAX protease family)
MAPASLITPPNVIAAVLLLVPYLAAAFFPAAFSRFSVALPPWARFMAPALLAIPYLLVAMGAGILRWPWLVVYAGLPVALAFLVGREASVASANWTDFFSLAVLGLAVDLRWFEPAWPPHLAIYGKILLLDAGLYAFLAVRRLEGVGFDLRLQWSDVATGLKEVLWYAPVALVLGLALGFLHLHGVWPGPGRIALAWIFTFFFIAVPEELFFRGWLQNLLERRLGRLPALVVTAALFGLAHFNKRAAHFNWRYVLLAALAGVFYGRAWRRNRRVAASAVTHATVDALWSLWLR